MRDIVVESYRDAVLLFGPITRRSQDTGLQAAVDLSTAGTKLWFTVKAQLTDDDPLFQKTYVAGVSSNGITVTKASSTDDPNGTIEIARADVAADVLTTWWWELLIEEPNDRRSTVERGAFKVVESIANPA